MRPTHVGGVTKFQAFAIIFALHYRPRKVGDLCGCCAAEPLSEVLNPKVKNCDCCRPTHRGRIQCRQCPTNDSHSTWPASACRPSLGEAVDACLSECGEKTHSCTDLCAHRQASSDVAGRFWSPIVSSTAWRRALFRPHYHVAPISHGLV
jgi:hypothetical protein